MKKSHITPPCVPGLRAIAVVALASLCLPWLTAKAQQPVATPNSLPRYVVGPPNNHKINHGLCFRELFEKPDQWKATRALTGALLYADWTFSDFTDAELKVWFAQMRQWNIKLELEVGGIKEWGPTGALTFKHEKPAWDRIQRLGGIISSVAMDEPLCCVREFIHKSDEYAIEETANFIGLVRANFPNMLVGDVEPYPSLPLAAHIQWIDALQKRLVAKKIKGLDFYRVDPNWIVYDVRNEGSWNDVKKLEHYCRSIKLPFSLIYWSPNFDMMKNRGIGDDSTWLNGVMAQGYAYESINGAPDQYVVESWVSSPSHSVPETADYSFTRSVLEFGRKFVKPRK